MRRFVADTTALIVFSTVVGSIIEMAIVRMDFDQSLRARLVAIPVIVLTARPYGVYRDWAMRAWATGGALRRIAADTVAFGSFQLPIYWGILAFAGASLGEIAASSATAIALLFVSGRPYGILLEAFRRLFGARDEGASVRRRRVTG